MNEKKYAFDLPHSTKKINIRLSVNNSCFFRNYMQLGNINYKTRSKSVYVGSCFACDLGFSVSMSGYSPMTFSPYNGEKRQECGVIPPNIVYEQYTRHKKMY